MANVDARRTFLVLMRAAGEAAKAELERLDAQERKADPAFQPEVDVSDLPGVRQVFVPDEPLSWTDWLYDDSNQFIEGYKDGYNAAHAGWIDLLSELGIMVDQNAPSNQGITVYRAGGSDQSH